MIKTKSKNSSPRHTPPPLRVHPSPEKNSASQGERYKEEQTPEEKILEGLNPQQKQAVLHDEGPLLIVAGAGTGKTTVLTKRIAYLITSKKALPNQILALTFTDKAAQEMEERVDALVPYGFNDVWISTFHAFGDKLLREHAFEIGFSPDIRILTLPEAIVFVRQNLYKFKLEHYRPVMEPARFVEALLTTFSRAKDEEVSPEEFIKYATSEKRKAMSEEEKEAQEKLLEVAEAYKTYEELKTAAGFIDFGDQVLLCLKILREHPFILKKVQERFKYILVDEFQDTNYAQFQLLKLLAEPHKNITVVGDDDQSIYKFRGACLSNILEFRRTYPDAREIVLQQNYRSTQEILDCAYKLIQHNNPDRLEVRDKINKCLIAEKGHSIAPQYFYFDTLFSESEFVAGEIQRRIALGKSEPRDFAILVRANANAEPFMKSLNLAGIPWQFSGNAGLYEQEEVRMVLAFLRTLDNPEDSASLYYLAISPLYHLDAETCAQLTQLADKTKKSLWEIFQQVSEGHSGEAKRLKNLSKNNSETTVRDSSPAPTLSETNVAQNDSLKLINRIVTDIRKYRQLSAKIATGNVLYKFLEEQGIFQKLAESSDYRSAQQAQNLQRFFEIIKKFSRVARYDRVHYFIQHVESLRLAGDDPSSAELSFDENAVHILTVHAAKGLEFPVVFLVGLEQQHFPVTDRGEPIELPDTLIKDILPQGNSHIQEERRLFYVGLTRAKEELILCSARDLGKKKAWKTSQFVLECMDKPQVSESVIPSKPLDSLKIFSTPTFSPPYKRGDDRGSQHTALETLSLPVTAIEDYLTCPLKYKFARVLKIPVLMHHTQVFGIAIHEALKVFHLLRKEGKKIKLPQVLEAFKRAWKSEGFVSREHEEKRFQEGIRILKSYMKLETRSQTVPSLVEENFKMNLEGAQIRGRWDRVDMNEKEAVIIDYKTGDVKDQKEADKKAKESIQLILYALAFQNRFAKLPERMVLNFLRKGIIGTVLPEAEKIEKAMEKTKSALEGIGRGAFEPTPGYHCHWCAFEKICPAINKS